MRKHSKWTVSTHAVITVVLVIVAVEAVLIPRQKLQNDGAGALSAFNTKSAPVMTLQLAALSSIGCGIPAALALLRSSRERRADSLRFMLTCGVDV